MPGSSEQSRPAYFATTHWTMVMAAICGITFGFLGLAAFLADRKRRIKAGFPIN